MFDRANLIQLAINKLNAKTYLEIGVFKGFCLLKIVCKQKYAVDPDFKIKKSRLISSCFRNKSNLKNQYFQMTSDDFFQRKKKLLTSSPPKVVFIDGLHTFEQTLQDCYNSLNYLADRGVIILHDCPPPSSASATVSFSINEAKKIYNSQHSSGWTDEWCGDSWKTIPFLIKNNPELNISVLNTDYGLGIISKKKGFENKIYQMNTDIQNYKSLEYCWLEANRKEILNLKELEDLNAILADHDILEKINVN